MLVGALERKLRRRLIASRADTIRETVSILAQRAAREKEGRTW